MKGKCPHNWDKWHEEHEKERERIRKLKLSKLPSVTVAKEKRHFDWVKNGQK
jgi:hypothetical protein